MTELNQEAATAAAIETSTETLPPAVHKWRRGPRLRKHTKFKPVSLTTEHADFIRKCEALLNQGWMQREIAKHLKVHEAQLSHWLRRRTRLSYQGYLAHVGTLNKLLALRKAQAARWGKPAKVSTPAEPVTVLPHSNGVDLLTKVAGQLSPEDVTKLVGQALALWQQAR